MNFNEAELLWGAHNKSYVLMVYALFGLFIALCPALAREREGLAIRFECRGLSTLLGEPLWKHIELVIAALCILWVTKEYRSVVLLLLFGVLAVVPSRATSKFNAVVMLSSFLALCVSASILWWRKPGGALNLHGFELLAFGLITFIFIYVFSEKEPIIERGFSFKWLLPYLFVAAILSFSTGILS